MNNQRVIKFRVWDGEWFNYLDSNPFDGYELFVDWDRSQELTDQDNGVVHVAFDKGGYIWQQFTGLQDRNGHDVYEGDILNTKAARWEVVFENGAFVGKVIASGVFGIGHTLPLSTILEHAIPMGNVCENR